MSDSDGNPDDRRTIDDASAPARSTMPDPDVHGGPVRETLPDVDEAGLAAGADRPHDTGELDPPTEEDVVAPAPDAEPKTRRAWVYLLIGGLFFAALAGPVLFYFFVWRYRPTAVQHIPAGTNAAIRFDGNELYLFAPFRENVLSVIADDGGTAGRAEHLKKLTGVDLRTDVREVVIATTTGEGYVVLLGGKFERARLSQDRFVPGLAKFFAEEGVGGFQMDGDVLVGHGVRIAQAEDSTVIIATTDESLHAAMEPSEAWTKLGISSSGAASFVVDRPALSALGRTLPEGPGSALANADKVTGYLKLGDKPSLFIDVVPHEGTQPEALAKDIEAAIASARIVTLLLPDAIGEKEALANAKVKPRAQTVMVETEWPKSGLEQGTKTLGSALKALFTQTQP
ncbi:MAG TPA: hypothetical protein VL400_05090 [Polyangiaceae bacterium]|nr:hypothetical protein [Polyangiaceae bacterium]